MAKFKIRKPEGIVGSLTSPDQSGVNFQDIIKGLEDTTGGEAFRKGLLELKGSDTIRPETQKALETIRARTAEDTRQRVASAMTLADKRGIGGSSVEQFGVQTGITEAQRAGAERELPFLLSGLEQDQTLQKMRGQAFFTLAGENIQNQRIMASLKSDELASIRNMLDNDKDRELQLYLGNLGVRVSMEQINASRDNAKRAERGQIIGSVIQGGAMAAAVVPF